MSYANYIAGKTYAAWVTWPDGTREYVIATLNELDRLYLSGCYIDTDHQKGGAA